MQVWYAVLRVRLAPQALLEPQAPRAILASRVLRASLVPPVRQARRVKRVTLV